MLLFAIALAFGVALKKAATDKQEISARQELNEYRQQGNLLPVVEVIAPRS